MDSNLVELIRQAEKDLRQALIVLGCPVSRIGQVESEIRVRIAALAARPESESDTLWARHFIARKNEQLREHGLDPEPLPPLKPHTKG